jgi:glucose/arabinose dehydrogenase
MASFGPASFARLLITVLGILLSSAGSVFALGTKLIESGLDAPIFLTSPDGDPRLFVVERAGVIKVRENGVWSEFLNISDRVSTSGERGLLGLAFDPNFASNRAFYVDYTDDTSTHIVRFTVPALNPTPASIKASATPILSIAQPNQSNHKAGWIGFRPGENDNLYIATGDGGGANDPDKNAQNTSSLLGKILRIDVHPANSNLPYVIPPGNPFGNEVWDFGLRNPFRNSFDRTKHNLIIGDVGQGAREEIDFEAADSAGGKNYGWRIREGDIATPGITPPDPNDPTNLPPTRSPTEPVHVYDHSGASSFAVTGGYVYRGSLMKDVFGEYFFADSETGKVWSLDTDPASGALLPNTLIDRTNELNPFLKNCNPQTRLCGIVSFGEDSNGNLYIVDLSGGQVFEVVPEPRTYAMMLFALLAMACVIRRRRSS